MKSALGEGGSQKEGEIRGGLRELCTVDQYQMPTRRKLRMWYVDGHVCRRLAKGFCGKTFRFASWNKDLHLCSVILLSPKKISLVRVANFQFDKKHRQTAYVYWRHVGVGNGNGDRVPIKSQTQTEYRRSCRLGTSLGHFQGPLAKGLM